MRAVLRIEAAHRRAEDRKDRDESPSSYVFEGQYAARGAGGVCDLMNKINRQESKKDYKLWNIKVQEKVLKERLIPQPTDGLETAQKMITQF